MSEPVDLSNRITLPGRDEDIQEASARAVERYLRELAKTTGTNPDGYSKNGLGPGAEAILQNKIADELEAMKDE